MRGAEKTALGNGYGTDEFRKTKGRSYQCMQIWFPARME